MNSTSLPAAPATSVLADEINAEHRACLSAANDAIDHAFRCGKLLSQAKVSIQHGDWQNWLGDNFDGSARTARAYMQLAERRDEIEAKRQRDTVLSVREARRLIAVERPAKQSHLIPSPDHALQFTRILNGGGDTLFIMPSTHDGYYYVAVMRDCGPDGGAIVEGNKRPIIGSAIHLVCELIGALPLIEAGKRSEFAIRPQKVNIWLYDGTAKTAW